MCLAPRGATAGSLVPSETEFRAEIESRWRNFILMHDFFDFRLKPRKYQKGMGPRLSAALALRTRSTKSSLFQVTWRHRLCLSLNIFLSLDPCAGWSTVRVVWGSAVPFSTERPRGRASWRLQSLLLEGIVWIGALLRMGDGALPKLNKYLLCIFILCSEVTELADCLAPNYSAFHTDRPCVPLHRKSDRQNSSAGLIVK